MTATKDQFVTIEYSFFAPDGALLGSSDYSGPFTFRHGYGDVVPGLDSRIEGAEVGEARSFDIPPQEAYGVRDESLVRRIPKEALPLDREAEPGLRVNVRGTVMVVTDVTDTEIVLDANHPLAGLPLHFDIRVIAVDDEDPRPDAHCSCGGTCDC